MPLDYAKRDGVAYITLNNPGKANILDKKMSDDISAAWIDLWEDRHIRCAILTGAGDKHFCGGHIAEMLEFLFFGRYHRPTAVIERHELAKIRKQRVRKLVENRESLPLLRPAGDIFDSWAVIAPQ